MFKIFETITSPLPPVEIILLLTIILAQNDCHTKNYTVFGFHQVTFTNCKQLSIISSAINQGSLCLGFYLWKRTLWSLTILSCLAETKLGDCLCYIEYIVLIQYLKETENKYLNLGTMFWLKVVYIRVCKWNQRWKTKVTELFFLYFLLEMPIFVLCLWGCLAYLPDKDVSRIAEVNHRVAEWTNLKTALFQVNVVWLQAWTFHSCDCGWGRSSKWTGESDSNWVDFRSWWAGSSLNIIYWKGKSLFIIFIFCELCRMQAAIFW